MKYKLLFAWFLIFVAMSFFLAGFFLHQPREVTKNVTIPIYTEVIKVVNASCQVCPSCNVSKTTIIMSPKQETKGKDKKTPTSINVSLNTVPKKNRVVVVNRDCETFFKTHPNAKENAISFQGTISTCSIYY